MLACGWGLLRQCLQVGGIRETVPCTEYCAHPEGWSWEWPGPQIRSSGEEWAAPWARRKLGVLLPLGPLGSFPALWAVGPPCGIGRAFEDSLAGGLGWPGVPGQEPGASTRFRTSRRASIQGRAPRRPGRPDCSQGTGTPGPAEPSLPGLGLYPGSFESWLLKYVFYCKKKKKKHKTAAVGNHLMRPEALTSTSR